MKSKYLQIIITSSSFIAVSASLISIVVGVHEFKNDLKINTILLATISALAGAFLSIFLKIISTRKNKSKIFISHSFLDNEIVDLIRNKLRSERFILNIDERNILIGENIKDSINKELDSSSIVIVILSKNSSKSEFVNYEIEKALEDGKKILPVIIDKDVTVPKSLSNIKYADLSDNKNKGLENIVKAIEYNL